MKFELFLLSQKSFVSVFDVSFEGCTCASCKPPVKPNIPPLLVLSSLSSLSDLVNSAWKPEARAQLLAVPRRLVSNSTGGTLSKRLQVLKSYDKSHPISVSVAKSSGEKPSEVIVFVRYPDAGLIAKSSAIGKGAFEFALSMVFTATLGTSMLTVLFDSGSSNSFMKHSQATQMGLTPRFSEYRAANTANGGSGQISGAVDIPNLKWTLGLVTPVTDVLLMEDLLL